MSKTVCVSSISPPPGQKDLGARLAASVQVDQVEGTTSQSIRKSSSRALPAGDLSGISTHLNPGGADGACADGVAGSLNLASETPSLTPALMAEYSTQYVSSSPIPAAMSGNSSPKPINPTAASPSLEATDLRTASHLVGAGGTTLQDFQRFLQHRRFVLRRQIAAADAFDQIVFQDQLKEVQSSLSLTADFLKAMTERRA